MKANERVALFDLDGTLADYPGALEKDVRRLFGIDTCLESLPLKVQSAARSIITSQEGWFRKLPVNQQYLDLLNAFRELGFTCHVLTNGPITKPHAWTDKFLWCQENLPDDVQVTITRDKGLVYGKVLVDDWPDYIKRWLEWRPRGLVFMPDHPYNRDFSHPNVIRVEETTAISDLIYQMGMRFD